jgi:hypothetical protein
MLHNREKKRQSQAKLNPERKSNTATIKSQHPHLQNTKYDHVSETHNNTHPEQQRPL